MTHILIVKITEVRIKETRGQQPGIFQGQMQTRLQWRWRMTFYIIWEKHIGFPCTQAPQFPYCGNVGTLYFTKIRKYGNIDPLSVFYLAFVGTLGVFRIN